jgi:hypothetical protein
MATTYAAQAALTDLQQLAISSRSIYDRARQLDWLFFFLIPDPLHHKLPDANVPIKVNDQRPTCPDEAAKNLPVRELLEYDPQLNKPYEDDFPRIVCGYQLAREFAEELREFVTFWFASVAAAILPVSMLI